MSRLHVSILPISFLAVIHSENTMHAVNTVSSSKCILDQTVDAAT